MRQIDTLRRAGRNLNQSKVRTILTSSAIAIGAFAIITSLALGNGTRNYISSLIGTNVNEKTMQVNKQNMDMSMEMSGSNIKEYTTAKDEYGRELFTKEDIEKIKKVDGVKKVDPFQMLNLQYFTIEGSNKKWSTMLGTYDPLIKNETIAGQLPPNGTNIKNDEIVIPESSLAKFKINKDQAIGKKVTLYFNIPLTEENLKNAHLSSTDMMDQEKMKNLASSFNTKYEFKVVGVAKNTPLAMAASVMAVNLDIYKKIGDEVNKGTPNFEKYSSSIVTIKDNQKPEIVKANIEKATGFSAMTAQDLQKMMFQMVNILQAVVIAFGALALLVSIFGIVNTMYVSVLERINQIGLMKALGMRNSEVGRMFRYEAAWIGFIGSIIGIALSWILGTILNPYISKAVGFKDGSISLLHYDPWQALGLTILLVVIAIIASLLPARKAAKLNPIDALRTE